MIPVGRQSADEELAVAEEVEVLFKDAVEVVLSHV
jgi:hypothetical protein